VRECWRGYGGMVEPLKERAEGEQSLIEGPHYFRVREGRLGGDLAVKRSIMISGRARSYTVHTVVQVVTTPPLT
jgi:hypothetical protein